MRRPALKKEGIVPTWQADHTLLLQGHRYREREICAGQSTGAVQTTLLAYTRLFECTAALNPTRDGPMGHMFN